MNYYTQVLSAKIGVSQAPHLVKGDALGDKASDAVGKVWRKIAHLLRRKKPPPNFYHRLESLLWEVLHTAHDTLGDGLEEISSSASALTQQLLFAALPPGHRNLLVATKAASPALSEAKATPAEEKEIKSLLFKPQSLAKAKAIVKAPTAGVSWQARLAQQTKLGQPKQLASIITQWRNSGKTPKEMEKAMLPFVQGVRTTARRVARTEAQRVASMTRMETYEELGDLAVGYQIHATMDSHTRPHHAARSGQIYYKKPQSGQLGLDKMPHPPHEPDGSVAFNCRCYITPVMDIQPHIENNPAAKKVFADADKQLIPDPSVYRDWFANATATERAKAVGASRLRAIQSIIGVNSKADWSHMLDPVTGKLLTVQQIKNESEAQRNNRLGKVMDVLSKRKLLARQVAQFGYVSPPVEQAVMGIIPPSPTPPLLSAPAPIQIPAAPIQIPVTPIQIPVAPIPSTSAPPTLTMGQYMAVPAPKQIKVLSSFKIKDEPWQQISVAVMGMPSMIQMYHLKDASGQWNFDGLIPVYMDMSLGAIQPIHAEIEAAYNIYKSSSVSFAQSVHLAIPPTSEPYNVSNPGAFPGKAVIQTSGGLVAVDPSEVPSNAKLMLTQDITTGVLVPKLPTDKIPSGHIPFYVVTDLPIHLPLSATGAASSIDPNTGLWSPPSTAPPTSTAPLSSYAGNKFWTAPPGTNPVVGTQWTSPKHAQGPTTVSTLPPSFDVASWNQPYHPIAVNTQKAAIGIQPGADGQRIPYSPPLDLSRAMATILDARASVLTPPKGPLLRVKALGGTTGADLMRDGSGTLFVRKLGASGGHIQSEIAADRLYAACGVPVPKVLSVDEKGATIKLSEFIEGKSYADFMDSPDTPPEEKAKVKKQLQSQFAVDALLGNWDVTGMNRDNILIGKDGVAYRIDNGGAMGFRAQGTAKTSAQWNPYPTELWSMAQPERIGSGDARGEAAKLFHDLPWEETIKQIENLVASRVAILAAAPESDREMLGKRLDNFTDIAATHHVLTKDSMTVEHTKEILRHQQELRAAGMTEDLPLQIGDMSGTSNSSFDVYNTNLRGTNSLSERFEKYIKNDPELAYSWLKHYGEEQARSSDSNIATAMALIMLKVRPVDETTIYTGKYKDTGPAFASGSSKRNLKISSGAKAAGCTTKMAIRTTAAMQAWQMEIMRNVDMPNNNRAEGKVRMLRTESRTAIKATPQATEWDKPIDITGNHKPSMIASYSLFAPYEVYNPHLIAVEVPHHRIITSYLVGVGSKNHGMFANDVENEFIVMADSVPAFSYGRALPLTGKSTWMG